MGKAVVDALLLAPLREVWSAGERSAVRKQPPLDPNFGFREPSKKSDADFFKDPD
jgi:hypothetical protein